MRNDAKGTSSRKRITLVAGYDAKGVVHDYVVYLVRALSQVSDVYYFCDCEPDSAELAKLDGIAKWCGGEHHGRYDFGSWGMLIDRLGWDQLSSCDELLIVNDSIYGPMFDISDVLMEMDRSDCDFWGITANSQISYHIQSYFMGFKKNVLHSNIFREFWTQIGVFEDHLDFVKKHEIRLSSLLIDAGFKPRSLVTEHSFPNPSCFPSALMSKFSVPFVKVKCFKEPILNLWEDFIRLENEIKNRSFYPYNLIEDHSGNDIIKYNRDNSEKFSHHIYIKIPGIEIYSTGKMKVKFIFLGRKIFSLKAPRAFIARLSRYSAFRCELAR